MLHRVLAISMAAALACAGLPVSSLSAYADTPQQGQSVAEDLTVLAGESYTFEGNESHNVVNVYGTVSSDTPVICYFKQSDTVTNGQVINNVQFVSDYDEVVAILHTNDVHGHLQVEPYVKGLADQMKQSGEYSLVLTVSAGDIYGGGEAVAGSYNGELIPAIVDQVYDVIVPGNNDYGTTGVAYTNLLLTSLYQNTKTLCANMAATDAMDLQAFADSYAPVIGNTLFDELYEKVTSNADGSLNMSALSLGTVNAGEDPYDSTATFTTSKGTVVGLYGLTTNGGAMETQLTAQGSIASATASVAELKKEGASVIVGVGHTGWMGEGSTENSSNDTNSWQLANTVEDEDAFIDGHTHSVINAGEGVLVGDDNEFVNQAQCFGSCIGVCYLYIKDGKVIAKDGEVLTDLSGITPDATVQAMVDADNAKVESELGAAYATTDTFLNGERLSASNAGGSVRANETNLGDLMTDLIRGVASEKLGETMDFVAYPGYWLRSSIEEGSITLQDIQSVFANPTALRYVEYSASDIVSMVEKGLSSIYPNAEGTSFYQYSGIKVRYQYKDDSQSSGTPVTIRVNGTLIYDANNGGILVDDSYTAKGIFTLTGGEIDNWTDSTDDWICSDKSEVQTLVAEYLQTHTQGTDYVIYPNVIAPDNRVALWSAEDQIKDEQEASGDSKDPSEDNPSVDNPSDTPSEDTPSVDDPSDGDQTGNEAPAQTVKKKNQTIKGSNSVSVKLSKKKYTLKVSAPGKLSYEITKGAKKATVNKKGVLKLNKKGTVVVKVTAAKTAVYKKAVKKITVTIK
jgi:2',3'-cyclic-nucleotide 2'-phosphodiesterase (5'-nucleotidase family)